MKIKYEFVDGDVFEIEVSGEIGEVIADSKRREENLERNNRRHCYSLDALAYGDKDIYAQYTDITPESLMIHNEESEALYKAFSQLSEIQQRRLFMMANGMSMHEIAKSENVDYRAVYDSIESGRKKFKKFLKTPHQNS